MEQAGLRGGIGGLGVHKVVLAEIQGPSEVSGSHFFQDQLSSGGHPAVNLTQPDSGAVLFFFFFKFF